MLDNAVLFQLVTMLIAIVYLFSSRYAEQKRVNCAVHGTCPRDEDYGVTQAVDANHIGETDEILQGMVEYFKKKRADPETTVVMHEMLDNCRNEDTSCAFWALVGECDKSPGFMQVSCAPVCQSCDKLSRTTRCPVDPNASKKNVWVKGSLNELFHNLTTLPENQRYKPTVLSRPDFINDDTAKTANYTIGPWLMYFDNFLTNKEADQLITCAHLDGFKPSLEAIGSKVPDPRAPASSWLGDSIAHDKVVRDVAKRIEKITNIPQVNSESTQVLRYEKGQYHMTAHDFIYHQVERQPGARILAGYLFLSDVKEGGEQEFPEMHKTIPPKKGRAIFWPTVLDEDPNKIQPFVVHGTNAVRNGLLYGANVWIHQRDFKGPIQNNCH